VAHVIRRQHPAEMRAIEPTIGGILDEVLVVVPAEEAAEEGGQERDDPEGADEASVDPCGRRGEEMRTGVTGHPATPARRSRVRLAGLAGGGARRGRAARCV